MSVKTWIPDHDNWGEPAYMREPSETDPDDQNIGRWVELRDYELLLKAREEESESWAKLVAYAQEHWPMETGRNVADVFIERADKMHAALTRLLAKETNRWKEQGYGVATCTSCGARREIEYGDHETPPRETREACSPSCPWRLAEEAIDAKPTLIQDQPWAARS